MAFVLATAGAGTAFVLAGTDLTGNESKIALMDGSFDESTGVLPFCAKHKQQQYKFKIVRDARKIHETSHSS